MQAFMDNLFDTYGRKARLYPAFLALLPAFVVVAVYTNWLELEFKHALFALVGAAVLFFLADLSRQMGKAVERKLLDEWGVFPSVSLLRHRDETFDPYTTEKFHRSAAALMPELVMPDRSDEERDPTDADNKYRAITTALLPLTRDTKKFSMIFKENINYGFRRNLLGLKPIGLLIVIGSISFCVFKDWENISVYSFPNGKEAILICGGLIVMLTWVFGVTKKSVKYVAVDYGRQLLMALDQIK